MSKREVDGEELMRQMIAVLRDHFMPMRDSLLDGTISCKRCAVLVLRENAQRHEEWHQSLNRALQELAKASS